MVYSVLWLASLPFFFRYASLCFACQSFCVRLSVSPSVCLSVCRFNWLRLLDANDINFSGYITLGALVGRKDGYDSKSAQREVGFVKYATRKKSLETGKAILQADG